MIPPILCACTPDTAMSAERPKNRREWEERPFDVPWHEQGVCYSRGYRPFFTDDNAEVAKNNDAAVRICWGDDTGRKCPVMSQCLRSSLNNRDRYGVWGGMLPIKRRRLLERVVAEEITVDQAVREVHSD